MIKVQDATKYLRNPKEKAVKYCIVNRVNTYPKDQKMTVMIA